MLKMGLTVKEKGQSWQDVHDKIIADTGFRDKGFHKWFMAREHVGSKMFGSEMWVKMYNIWKKANKDNSDYFGVVIGKEG